MNSKSIENSILPWHLMFWSIQQQLLGWLQARFGFGLELLLPLLKLFVYLSLLFTEFQFGICAFWWFNWAACWSGIGCGIEIHFPGLRLCLLRELLFGIQEFVVLISSQNCLNDVLLASWAVFETLEAFKEFVVSRLAKNGFSRCVDSFVFILCQNDFFR